MNLTIDDPDSISLPNWLGETNLTLEEIGAVTCIACMQSDPDWKSNPAMVNRIGSEEFAKALMSLQKKKVLAASMEGTRVGLSLDLNRALPPES